jgi:hypothetical protein
MTSATRSAKYGLAATAQWLGWACGLSHRTAVEHVWHIESLVQGLRTAEAATIEQSTPDDYVRHGWNAAGRLQLSARLEPESSAVLTFTLDAIARAEELSPAEALARMAEIALAAINDRATPPRILRGDERAAIVVHVDESRLAADETECDGEDAEARSRERAQAIGRIAEGPGLPRPVIERLLCSGRIRTAVVAKDQAGQCNVLDLGRSQRIVSERQFKALLLRDGGCSHPGCHSRNGLEAHHVKQWIRGGRTDLANLVLLCRRHHHRLHDREFTRSSRSDRAGSTSGAQTGDRYPITSTAASSSRSAHRLTNCAARLPTMPPARVGTVSASTATTRSAC